MLAQNTTNKIEQNKALEVAQTKSLRPQTSELRPQTSDLRPQTNKIIKNFNIKSINSFYFLG